ncbi:MAG: hypothetical protein WBY94_22390 [Polyangiaceae bacterium]
MATGEFGVATVGGAANARGEGAFPDGVADVADRPADRADGIADRPADGVAGGVAEGVAEGVADAVADGVADLELEVDVASNVDAACPLPACDNGPGANWLAEAARGVAP